MWNISYYSAALAAASGNGVSAGLFIPDTDLPGIVLSELSDALARQKKVAFALSNKIYSAIASLGGGLGFTSSKSNPSGAGLDLINQNFQFNTNYVVDHRTNTASLYPLPASQTGIVKLENIFPGCSFVVSEGAIPGAGVLIPNSIITSVGGSIPSTVSVDARSYLSSFHHSMILNNPVDDVSIIVSERQDTSGVTPPTNFTSLTNLTNSDLPYLSYFSRLNSISFRLILNQSTQAFDVVI